MTTATCECGAIVSKDQLARHRRTVRHTSLMFGQAAPEARLPDELPSEVWCSKCDQPSIVAEGDPLCEKHAKNEAERLKLLILAFERRVHVETGSLRYRTAEKHQHQFGARAVANTAEKLRVAEEGLARAKADYFLLNDAILFEYRKQAKS